MYDRFLCDPDEYQGPDSLCNTLVSKLSKHCLTVTEITGYSALVFSKDTDML